MGSDFSNLTIYPEDELYLFFEKFGKKLVGNTRLYFIHEYSPEQGPELERLKLKPSHYSYFPPLLDIDSYAISRPKKCIIKSDRAFTHGFKEEEVAAIRFQKGIIQENFKRTVQTVYGNEEKERKYDTGFNMFDMVEFFDSGKKVESENALKAFLEIFRGLEPTYRGPIESKIRNPGFNQRGRTDKALSTIDKISSELGIPKKIHSKIYGAVEMVERERNSGYYFDVDLPVGFERKEVGGKDYIFLDIQKELSFSEFAIDAKNWKFIVVDLLEEAEDNIKKIERGFKLLKYRDYGAESQVKYAFSEHAELEAVDLRTLGRKEKLESIIFGENMVKVRADLLVNGFFQ